MALILNIDTALENASICLSLRESSLEVINHGSQENHASWLLEAIKTLLQRQKYTLSELSAIAVTAGPGSYTGLRIAMSTAKGMCYALKIPLLNIDTLDMMVWAAKDEQTDLLCPMIDARRMEVFTALYDRSLQKIWGPTNQILETDSFSGFLKEKRICFFGSGAIKWIELVRNQNAEFKNIEVTAKHMINLSYTKYMKRDFANLAYATPDYGKEFYTRPPKQSI
ncbi:MAG: tRNA (adenosine(37)-N6)-threonylcarbamoyltransferase complex dimerization subunit type 1 TsaB [Flavisolibacter sp.]